MNPVNPVGSAMFASDAEFFLFVSLVACWAVAVTGWLHWRGRASDAHRALRDHQERQGAFVAQLTEMHGQEIGRLEARHREEMTRTLNLRIAGTPDRAEAVVVPGPVPPEAMARAVVAADVEERAVRVLLDRHRAAGVPLTLEEARAQARRMLAGQAPVGHSA